METIDARKLPPKAQEALRFRAVKAVEDGMTHEEAARVFGVARTTVTNWVKLYKKGSNEALKIKKRGRPRGGKLMGWQAAAIVRMIIDRCPDQMKFPFALWTREAVAQLIKRKYSIELSIWTVGRYLRGWGLSPQKPIRRAYERNPVAVGQWLHSKYPAIRYKARKEKAGIHWGDEMGVRSDHQVGRSWGIKGQKPVVEGTGKRFRCNMISSITNQGTLRFKVFEGSFNISVFQDFLKRLIKSSKNKVFLILDRHPVHRSKTISKWAEANKDKIEIFFLPPYSPELNPDEYLNNDVKSNAVGRRRPSTKEELIANIRNYLQSTQKQPFIVKGYFKARPVRYAA
jgi:transposase